MAAIADKPARFRSPCCEPGHRAGVPNPNRGKKLPVEILKRSEVQLLMSAANRGITGDRSRAEWAIMYRTGARVGEVCALRNVDVDEETRTVRIRGGKTDNADRLIGVDDECLRLVRKWKGRKRELGIGPEAPLFCTVVCDWPGRPRTPAGIRNTLRTAALKVGLEKRCHPHGFRHSFACEFMEETKDLRLVSKALGHSSFAVTQTYLDHVYAGDVVEAMATRVWSFDQPAPAAVRERITTPASAWEALEALGA